MGRNNLGKVHTNLGGHRVHTNLGGHRAGRIVHQTVGKVQRDLESHRRTQARDVPMMREWATSTNSVPANERPSAVCSTNRMITMTPNLCSKIPLSCLSAVVVREK